MLRLSFETQKIKENYAILKKESRPTFRDRTTFFYYKSLSAMTNNMIANNSLIFYNYPNRFL